MTWRLISDADRGPESVEAPSAQAAPPQSLEEMRELAEQSEDDALPWQQLGYAYFDNSMFAEAAQAYGEATRIETESAALWSALGEAMVMATQAGEDPLPAAALEAFRSAIAIDSSDPRARYFLAVEKDVAGDHEGAVTDWLALLADTQPGAPWENDLVRTINQVAERENIDLEARIEQALSTRNILPAPVAEGIPGPTREQMAAAAAIAPGEQEDMAEDMVARLAARIESEPQNVDGWIMLMRSYQTLGRYGEAREAYDRGLAANPNAEAQFQAASEALGL